MKKNIICALFLVIAVSAFCQQTKILHSSSREDYLAKSKRQKTAAWVLLGGGVALIGTGFLIGDRKESSFGAAGTGVIMGGIGLLSAIGSIPLFIASAKNKRKGLSLTFKNERTLQLAGRNFLSRSVPSVGLRLSL